MNQNTQYEKFAQEIYQGLIDADGIKTIDVQHNIKLSGKSGQRHQIDVYWEYEIAGVNQKVAIECKNYSRKVPLGKVRDFHSVLSDLINVAGVMVTKVGYQSGAKQYADHHGIDLIELRPPNEGEGIIGKLESHIEMSIRQRLFLLDEQWAEANHSALTRLREFLDLFFPNLNSLKVGQPYYYPLTTKDDIIQNQNGRAIANFGILESKLPDKAECIYPFEDAYVDTLEFGQVKIKEVKYSYEEKRETKVFAINARDFIKAIIKDALTGKIKMVRK